MSEPFRVAIWGPGDAGSICAREIIRLPECDLVGVYGYSDSKVGRDIGTVVGVDPIGVLVTSDRDEFLAIDCDVVIHTGLDYPGAPTLADYVTLLEAGKNVITSHPYNNLDYRGEHFRDTIVEAARRGGVTWHATGANPDFVGQRLAMTLTGFSNDVRQIKIEEYFDCIQQANPSILRVIGLGGDPDQAMDDPTVDDPASNSQAVNSQSVALWYQRQYWFQMIQHLADRLGVELSRIEANCHSVAAPTRLVSPVMTIEPGRTGNVCYESIGYVGDDPFIVMRVGWYLTEVMRPENVTADCQWIFSIEGRPSTRTVMSIEPTLTDTDAMAGETGAPGYVGFGICLVQAIPAVVDAPPGVLATDFPRAHWRKDMRATRAAAFAAG